MHVSICSNYGYSHHIPQDRRFLKESPLSCALPRDFTRLCALRGHMIEVLKQFSCPQSAIHGWAGLVMHPTMYALIEMIPFAVPRDPGNVPMLPSFAVPAVIKISKHQFERDKTYFTSYKKYLSCVLEDAQ
jgi:hypothetical protein